MEANLSALERAFQLARSGQVTDVIDIKAQLKREGYDLGQILLEAFLSASCRGS
jgi:hypothetical protein